MKRKTFPLTPSLFAVAFLSLVFAQNATAEVDEQAAKKLAKVNNCFKCHAAEKEKDGPSYKKVAEKYRGKADGEEKVIAQITTGKMAKFPDGHEEEHRAIENTDMSEIKNLAQWILSL